MDVSIDGGAPVSVSFTNASAVLHIYGYVPSFDIPFSNGLQNFQASGTVAGTPVSLRMAAGGGSGGRTTIGSGQYIVSSIVDFFPEISLDNGQNWTLAGTFGTEMDLEAQPTPEPSSILLLGSAAGLGLLAHLRRR